MRDSSIHLPGQGCGCPRCREPLPTVEVQTPDQAAAKQAAYEASRAAWRNLHNFPSGPAGRGIKTRGR